MGLKSLNITDIALTTGGTVNILNGAIALPLTAFLTAEDACTEYRITGTQALVADFIIAMTGTPDENTRIRFSWTATCTPGAFSVQILGKTIPADYLDKKFSVTLSYSGVAWITEEFNLDLMQLAVIPGDRIRSSSITVLELGNLAATTAKINDLAVTNGKIALLAVEGKNIADANVTDAKLADMVAYTMKVRNAGTTGVPSNIAVSAQSVLVRQAAGFVNLTPSADGKVIIRKAGVISADYVDFTELTGTIALGQIADDLLTLAKQQSTGLLYGKYTDSLTTAVVTEEILATYTLPAGTIATDGKGIRVVASGTTAANANTKTIRLKFGGTTYATNAVTTAPNASAWEAEFTILRSAAATSVAVGKAVVAATNEGVQRGTGTPTWANPNDVEVTGQNGTASAGDITLSFVTVEILK